MKSFAKRCRLGFCFFGAGLIAFRTGFAQDARVNPPAVVYLHRLLVQVAQTAISQIRQPVAVEIDLEGEVFLVDAGANRVIKFSPSLEVIARTSGWGTRDDMLDYPLDIAVDAGLNLLVADYNNGRVVRLDRDLNFLSQLRLNLLNDRWERPLSLALSDWGELLILEETSGQIIRVQVGTFIATEFSGYRPGQINLAGAEQLASGQGKVYVLDREAKTIVACDRYGNILYRLTPSRPVRTLKAMAGEGDFLFLAGDDTLLCYAEGKPVPLEFIGETELPQDIIDLAVTGGKMVFLCQSPPYLLLYRLSLSPARVEW